MKQSKLKSARTYSGKDKLISEAASTIVGLTIPIEHSVLTEKHRVLARYRKPNNNRLRKSRHPKYRPRVIDRRAIWGYNIAVSPHSSMDRTRVF